MVKIDWKHEDAVKALYLCRKMQAVLAQFEAGVDPQKREGMHGHESVHEVAAALGVALGVLKAAGK